MRRSKGSLRATCAAALAWGDTIGEAAARVGVDVETVREWAARDDFRRLWAQRYRDYVRYLQAPSVCILERQLREGDEKLKQSAANAILKLGERFEDEDGGSVSVRFNMPPPGEAD